jgi:hypothetical protein
MKPLKAFAIIDSDNKLACWNYRVPIYWRRKVALDECKNNCFADSRVVTVLVTLVEKSKKATTK